MLKEFSFRNCRSFMNEAVLSMEANIALKDNINFVVPCGSGKNKIHINPVAAIYGSNAGGKSNLLRALANAVTNISSDKQLNNSPFMFPFERDETFDHKLVIVCDGQEYEYKYTATNTEVLYESLVLRHLKSKGSEDVIFKRERAEVVETIFNEETINDYLSIIAANKSVLIMRIGGEIRFPYFWPLYRWCCDVKTHMRVLGDVERHGALHDFATELHENESGLSSFSDFMVRFDRAIDFVTTEEEKQSRRAEFILWHKSKNPKGKIRKLPFETERESNGTKKLMELYPMIKNALDNGYLLVYDELDTFMHPLIFRKIVEMFNDTKKSDEGIDGANMKGAQLIFAAHNTMVVNREDLRRDQIYFVDKDEYGCSSAKRLSDIEDERGRKIRLDASYDKLYLSGIFGAIPDDFQGATI